MPKNLTIELPAEKAFEYQKALLAMLSKIDVRTCEPFMKEHVKKMYELLGKLNSDNFRISTPKRTPNIKSRTS